MSALELGGGNAPVFGNDEASGRRSSKVNKNRLLVKYKKIQNFLKALPSIPFAGRMCSSKFQRNGVLPLQPVRRRTE